jgi:hypothetical protein
MGWMYDIEIVGTDGKPREVVIPNLLCNDGRRIWSRMKAALRRAGMDDRARQAIEYVDALLTGRHEDTGEDSVSPLHFGHRPTEQALGHIAAQIKDKLKLGTRDEVYEVYVGRRTVAAWRAIDEEARRADGSQR